MIKAGVEGQPVCLFLEDHQLMDSGFLECINSLLSGGEVHTLPDHKSKSAVFTV